MRARPTIETVAVTGIGIVSPIGFGRQQFWMALCAGRSGIGPIERFPVANGAPQLAAEIRGFAAREFIASAHLRRMDGFSRMIVAASRMALDDARLAAGRVDPERAGVVIGSVLGDIVESATYLERVFAKGPAVASPMTFPNLVLNAAASYVSMELGLTGVNLTVSQGETSGEQAIALACDLVRAERADVVLAGGGDGLSPVVCEVYRRARALSAQHGGREWSSPYDVGRNGIILGEGAAMLVLESTARARARGAPIYAEIDGNAAFGVPAPPYDWPAQARAALPVLRHLVSSGSNAPAAVDLICAGANSSRRLDACELDVFSELFGKHADAMHLTSIKGAVGEFGAAGALTAAAAALALHTQTVPPLCHLETPESGVPFRFAAQAEARPINRALLCGFAHGGAGAALVLHRARQ
jgi:3-oxoacyl-[acyl-carrier-protein] synthase II